MKDKWYADNRDLVKWGGIVHLCKEKRIGMVFQVAYYSREDLKFGERHVTMPTSVLEHFRANRNIEDIKRLENPTGIHIDVFDKPFDPKDRDKYHKKVCDDIRKLQGKKLVFLDPDTGMEPDICTATHVKSAEVSIIWKCLKPGDILGFYQHAQRNKKKQDNFDRASKKLSKACFNQEDTQRVHYWSSQIASDVRCFYIEKTH